MNTLDKIHVFVKSLGLGNEDVAIKDIDEIIYSDFIINIAEQGKTEKVKLLDSAKSEDQIDAVMESLGTDDETKELFNDICYKVTADWWANIKPTLQTDKIQTAEERFQNIKSEK